MLCKYYWIVLYTVHFTAFCLGGPFFPGHGVVSYNSVTYSVLLQCHVSVSITVFCDSVNYSAM